MKNNKLLLLFIFTITLSAFTSYQTTNWEITDDYAIKFTSKNPSGIFKSFKGDIVFDENDLSNSYASVTIDVNSINTGNGMKNKHAKSDKWFDAAKYPTITFKSSVIKKNNNYYAVTGKLKIKNIEKEVIIPVNFKNNTFTASFEVDRMLYKVGNMKGMNKKASRILKIDVSIPVTK